MSLKSCTSLCNLSMSSSASLSFSFSARACSKSRWSSFFSAWEVTLFCSSSTFFPQQVDELHPCPQGQAWDSLVLATASPVAHNRLSTRVPCRLVAWGAYPSSQISRWPFFLRSVRTLFCLFKATCWLSMCPKMNTTPYRGNVQNKWGMSPKAKSKFTLTLRMIILQHLPLPLQVKRFELL